MRQVQRLQGRDTGVCPSIRKRVSERKSFRAAGAQNWVPFSIARKGENVHCRGNYTDSEEKSQTPSDNTAPHPHPVQSQIRRP